MRGGRGSSRTSEKAAAAAALVLEWFVALLQLLWSRDKSSSSSKSKTWTAGAADVDEYNVDVDVMVDSRGVDDTFLATVLMNVTRRNSISSSTSRLVDMAPRLARTILCARA